ncbi:cation transport protein-domain-containing protein [Lineolata rhizophorae]|uniref:Cation transport protein-domain-containing protein n=1 Tax=Lineolata rhizophorae TaxID=578093 RepID=A0A6A6NPP3_9PEZI|nr:cation transport protein-domain-containing protein [Lineolata rhizophorae]
MLATPALINTAVVLVRLQWFERKFKHIVSLSRLQPGSRSRPRTSASDYEQIERGVEGREIRVLHPEGRTIGSTDENGIRQRTRPSKGGSPAGERESADLSKQDESISKAKATEEVCGDNPIIPAPTIPLVEGETLSTEKEPTHIRFASAETHRSEKTIRVPGPREVEKGHTIQEIHENEGEADSGADDDGDRVAVSKTVSRESLHHSERRTGPNIGRILPSAMSIERATSSAFVMGGISRHDTSHQSPRGGNTREPSPVPYLSYRPIVGRNSQFKDLTREQREELGGIEYRSLKLLAKILIGYYVGFHLFGAICLIPWIHRAASQYQEYLVQMGQNRTWWAIFSSMTTFNNLGFTVTPDSMAHYRTAVFPLLVMTFLIYIGNTCYPLMLRLSIWIFFKLTPRKSSVREPLNFLLDHPRRCYTLLFPRGPTWMLFWILFALNLLDIVLLIVLDLNNPEVNSLPAGYRIVAAIFQAASSRTAGTSTFNIGNIHPAAQFSLLVMMYISSYPISMSIRRTNIYEETSLGIYETSEDVDESSHASFVTMHLKKQLAFDLWYMFIGVFVICIAEGGRIAARDDYVSVQSLVSNRGLKYPQAFQVFTVFFEVVSAYGNVGLSLGYPTVNTSLSGEFTTLSKVVICAMMIRGRHRGLPYELDRAILLPSERLERLDTGEVNGSPRISIHSPHVE